MKNEPMAQTKSNLQSPSILGINQDGSVIVLSENDFSTYNGLVWIRLNLNTAHTFLKKMGTIPALVKAILLAKETRPRTLAYDNTLIATFRGVNLNPGSVPEDMVSVRVWMKENLIITVHNRPLASISDIEKALRESLGPKTVAEFLQTLLRTLIDKSAEVVSALGDRLDHVEDILSEKPDSTHRSLLNDMRRRLILLRRYLLPQRDAITRIPVDKLSWLTDVDLMHLREISDASTRLLEDLDAERERANVIHEELFAVAQEALNKKMYLLTIVAVIFMPLSFITGLLGINVGGIPGATFRYGFFVVCLLLFSIFLCQFMYLKRKRWI